MIICVGEILADMVGERKGSSLIYECKAGGAPFNVACALKKLGVKTGFVGCVGQDQPGDFLEKVAKSRDFDFLNLKKIRSKNTTLAFVTIDEMAERSFCFYRKNTADVCLPLIGARKLSTFDIVHIGSLMLSEKRGFAYAKDLIKKAHSLGKIVSFDVNIRADLFSDFNEMLALYREIIDGADIVKFSEEEFSYFYGTNQETRPDQLILVTYGEKGSEWRYQRARKTVKSISVKPIDTTGAGDAFFAGVLSELDKGVCKKWNAAVLNQALLFGNACGALNTLEKGAIDGLPTYLEVKNQLRNL